MGYHFSTEVNNGKTYKYGEEYGHTICFPTKTILEGISKNAVARSDIFTAYYYSGSQYILDKTSTIYKMLFGNDDIAYWLASRGTYLDSSIAGFNVHDIRKGGVDRAGICSGLSNKMNEYEIDFSVRPIVYLKPNIQTSAQDENGTWIISE